MPATATWMSTSRLTAPAFSSSSSRRTGRRLGSCVIRASSGTRTGCTTSPTRRVVGGEHRVRTQQRPHQLDAAGGELSGSVLLRLDAWYGRWHRFCEPPPGFSGSAGFSDGPSLSPFVTKAWAPEWFVDGDRVNVILSMSTGGGFVPYLMTALEPSLRLWSPPVPLAGIGADHIDTTVVKVGSTYHAFTKNETKKVVEHAVAPSVTGPYSFVPPGNWGGSLVEGPAVVQLPSGDWRIYLDAYTEGKYLYSDSTDG